MREKRFFTFSFPVTLTFDLSTCYLDNLVQYYVSTKLEASTAFLFRENRKHGTYIRTDRPTDRRQTDGVKRLMRLPGEGRTTIRGCVVH